MPFEPHTETLMITVRQSILANSDSLVTLFLSSFLKREI